MFLYGDIQWTTFGVDNGYYYKYGYDYDLIEENDTYSYYYSSYAANEPQAGINAGDGMSHFSIPGSLTPEIINITMTSNVGIPGTWMFQLNCKHFVLCV